MAGAKGKSGGKRDGAGRKADVPPEPTTGAPVLEPTIASIEAYTAWALAQLDAGMCEPRVHDGRNKSIAEMRKTLALRHGMDELEVLREMVTRSEAAANRRKQNEIEDRYSGGQPAEEYPGVQKTPADEKH